LLKMDTLTITDPTLLLRKLGLYLTAHDGLESNIGLTHDYWTCLSQYRMALNKS
jgi:hypothetical protein